MIRRKMLAAGALGVLMLAVSQVPGAAETAPKAAPKAASQDRGSSAQLPKPPTVRGLDCANVKNEIKSQINKLSPGAKESGKGMVNCVRSSKSVTATKGNRTVAEFCPARLQRLQSCTKANAQIVIFTIPNGEIVGTSHYEATSQMFLDGRSDTWRHNFNVTFTRETGNVTGLTVSGGPRCVIECDPIGGTFISGSARPPSSLSATATFRSTFHGDNAVWTAGSAFTVQHNCPFCTPQEGNTLTFEAPRHRCDTKIGGKPAGCAYREIIPIHEISRLRFPKYAQHVDLAIKYKLPSLLTKTNQETADRNGRIACPPDDGALYARPPDMQCDEYPFRSTTQGASSQPYGRSMYIFRLSTGELVIDCKVKWLGIRASNDSGGYSVCMIPSDQNRGGGNDLGVFYYDNRVIEGDQFVVTVV